MRLLLVLIAGAILAPAGLGAANPSVETGDLSGWHVDAPSGDAGVVPCDALDGRSCRAVALVAPVHHPAPTLDQVASHVAGRPVHAVCVTDADAWKAEAGGGVMGFYDPSYSWNVYLGPYACQTLQDPESSLFGGGLLVLTHEAIHATGLFDESLTECKALELTPQVAQDVYGVQDWRLDVVMYAARRLDSMLPVQYHGPRC